MMSKVNAISKAVMALTATSGLEDDPDWPLAYAGGPVKPERLTVRAHGILNKMLLKGVSGLKFLDFGCTSVEIVEEAARRDSIASGYVLPHQEPVESPLIRTDYHAVKAAGPYDLILAYDVFDHCESPIAELSLLRDLLTGLNMATCRFHPWCGRGGGHHPSNRAFMHYLDDDRVDGVVTPLSTYGGWLKAAGLAMIKTEVHRTPVEDYFRQPRLKSRLIEAWSRISGVLMDDLPTAQMSIDYVDVTVVRS